MKQIITSHWPFGVLLSILSLFFVWGIPFVPFHPDESTNIFMSSDFEILVSKPNSLSWQHENEGDLRQHYRTIDAPLTRYLIGFGRTISGQEALTVDWDWSKSWEENLGNEAYPNENLLFSARMAITSLLPLSLVLIYLIGIQIQGKLTGFLAALLLGTQAIVLLHSRRAMTEGVLVFGILFTLWACLQNRPRPWLIGLGVALAINAKHSALPMLPVGLIAIIWSTHKDGNLIKKVFSNIVQFGVFFLIITFALNPVYWKHPAQALQATVTTRISLTQQQISDTQEIASDKYLGSYGQRLLVLFANIYVGPAEHSLVANLEPTIEAVNRYIDIPGHNLMRGLAWGAFGAILTTLGVYMTIRSLRSKNMERVRSISILLLAAGLQTGALIAAVPLPWARFSLPVIPFCCLFMAYGLAGLRPKRTPAQI